MKTIIIGVILIVAGELSFGQSPNIHFEKAYYKLRNMLDGKEGRSFSDAVFTVENAYLSNTADSGEFRRSIAFCASVCREIMYSNQLVYNAKDVENMNIYAAVFKFMTDTVAVTVNDSAGFYHFPYRYNFEDFAGETDWSTMFVTTLMRTHKGNCHSLPILYKLIVEYLGGTAWLSVAPNHFYIKLYSKEHGWYNTELTNASFPTDAWITASGYVHTDAIRSGIYMDTLSLEQDIAVCMTDLALAYRHAQPNDTDEFILRCCEKALEHYPHYINALLLKAEIYALRYQQAEDKHSEDASYLLSEMNDQYLHIHRLGYRKMPKEMYIKWLNSLRENREKRESGVKVVKIE